MKPQVLAALRRKPMREAQLVHTLNIHSIDRFHRMLRTLKELVELGKVDGTDRLYSLKGIRWIRQHHSTRRLPK